MKGLVLTGGEGPDKELFRRVNPESDVIIAADSGLDLAARLDLEPDWFIGDMDSVNPELAARFSPQRSHILPRDKDETDTEAAIAFLSGLGVHEWCLVGAGGGRLDHLMGVLALYNRPMPPVIWISARAVVYLLTAGHEFQLQPGLTISFFPAGQGPVRAWTSGLKWDLGDLVFRQGEFGVSNVVTHGRVRVELQEGRLLLVMPEPAVWHDPA